MHPATLLKLLWNCLNETKGQRHHTDLKTPQSLTQSSMDCTPHNKPDPPRICCQSRCLTVQHTNRCWVHTLNVLNVTLM